MTDKQQSSNQAPPPHAQLVQMAMAHWMSQIVYAAAKLNLADHLAQGGIAVVATHQDLALPAGSRRTLQLK